MIFMTARYYIIVTTLCKQKLFQKSDTEINTVQFIQPVDFVHPN